MRSTEFLTSPTTTSKSALEEHILSSRRKFMTNSRSSFFAVTFSIVSKGHSCLREIVIRRSFNHEKNYPMVLDIPKSFIFKTDFDRREMLTCDIETGRSLESSPTLVGLDCVEGSPSRKQDTTIKRHLLGYFSLMFCDKLPSGVDVTQATKEYFRGQCLNCLTIYHYNYLAVKSPQLSCGQSQG